MIEEKNYVIRPKRLCSFVLGWPFGLHDSPCTRERNSTIMRKEALDLGEKNLLVHCVEP